MDEYNALGVLIFSGWVVSTFGYRIMSVDSARRRFLRLVLFFIPSKLRIFFVKHVLTVLFLVTLMIPTSGCGEPTYDIPEVSKEDSAKESERMAKEIEAEYKKNMGGAKK